jgi:hypothetical protein
MILDYVSRRATAGNVRNGAIESRQALHAVTSQVLQKYVFIPRAKSLLIIRCLRLYGSPVFVRALK